MPSEKVLSHADLKNRPDLVILACGQDIDTPSEKPLLAFLRKIASASVPFLALGAANAYAASMELIAKDKCVAHWETIGLLRENFPAVEFSNVLFETSGQVTSCAGELASLDFVVNFIESHCGSTIAQKICGHFLIESRRTGQAVQLLNASAMLCADQRIQNAVAMMIEHIEQPISIHEISTALSISTRQLERIFARYGFGSPCKYFKTLRLERARQLLEQSNLSVSEVALACGFECQTHFSKNYKKRYGVSPRGFRNPLGTQSRL
ncbi:GlxA family transcriptional regulator [Rhodobacteraceae bacterium nBUS_24]